MRETIPIFRRQATKLFGKQPGKMPRAEIPDLLRDLLDLNVGISQEFFGFEQANPL
jgi:hypothetical protein